MGSHCSAGGVSPGDIERAAAVEADLAYAGLAFGNGTAVAAGEAADAAVVQFLVEGGIGLADLLSRMSRRAGTETSKDILTPLRGGVYVRGRFSERGEKLC